MRLKRCPLMDDEGHERITPTNYTGAIPTLPWHYLIWYRSQKALLLD